MKPISQFPSSIKKEIRYLFTDVDGTLTVNRQLPSAVFVAMENLQHAGIQVIPVTGGCAGWCDHMARMWPIDGLVGENGAFYFQYRRSKKKMVRRYWKSAEERNADRKKLDRIQKKVLAAVPGCAVASDQNYRDTDLAIDYCNDVPDLPPSSVEAIKNIFEAAGANAQASSIHLNAWFGEYNKLAMCQRMLKEVFEEELEDVRNNVVYCGDAPNDAPMFGFFPHSVGVANIRRFEMEMDALPSWVTQAEEGHGFIEMVDVLLER